MHRYIGFSVIRRFALKMVFQVYLRYFDGVIAMVT